MKFLRREEVDINKIKPDPNQPRKYFDPEIIHSIATTMVSNLKKGQVGVINDIEIDARHIIITGEQRFKAAKLAGFKTIPCKIYEFPEQNERYFRQGLENLSRGSMTPLEMSDWVVKVLHDLGAKNINEPGSHMERHQQFVVTLSKKIGKTTRWVYDMLALQNEKPSVREYLKRPDSKYSIIREINNKAPEELQDRLKEKVVRGELRDRETTNELIRALTGYDTQPEPSPKIREELLETRYTEPRSPRNIKKIDSIYPENKGGDEEAKRESELGEELSGHITKMVVLLGRINLSKISPSRKPLIINSCKELIDRLNTIISVLSGKMLLGEEVEKDEE